jgi:hypothetical protein
VEAIVTQQGSVYCLARLLAMWPDGVRLCLAGAPFPPSDTTAGGLIETNFNGYARQSLIWDSGYPLIVGNKAVGKFAPCTFVGTGGPAPGMGVFTTVYGWWIEAFDVYGNLQILGTGLFGGVPRDMSVADKPLVVNLQMRMWSPY